MSFLKAAQFCASLACVYAVSQTHLHAESLNCSDLTSSRRTARSPLVKLTDRRKNPDLLVPVSELPTLKRVDDPTSDNTKKDDYDLKPITSVTLNIRPSSGELPEDKAKEIFEKAGEEFHGCDHSRGWCENSFAWVAPALAHRPLYFEDVNLERYGHHHGILQPAASAAHFFARIPVIPYMRGATPPKSCQYTLGYYRPGECVPHFCSKPKLRLKGAMYQATAVAGTILLVP